MPEILDANGNVLPDWLPEYVRTKKRYAPEFRIEAHLDPQAEHERREWDNVTRHYDDPQHWE